MVKSNTSVDRRKARVRRAVLAHSGGRPRLSVFRSSKQIYAQVIDDEHGRTIAAASSLEKAMRESIKTGADVEAARRVGKELAERAKKAGSRESGLRSRRLYVSRARQGAGGRRPRGRVGFLAAATEAKRRRLKRAAFYSLMDEPNGA